MKYFVVSNGINDRGSFTSNRNILLLGVINLLFIKYGVISADLVKVEVWYKVLILCQHNGRAAKCSSPHLSISSDLYLNRYEWLQSKIWLQAALKWGCWESSVTSALLSCEWTGEFEPLSTSKSFKELVLLLPCLSPWLSWALLSYLLYLTCISHWT